MKSQAKVLLFAFSSKKTEQVRELCRQQGISVIVVPRQDYRLKLGEIAEIDGFSSRILSKNENKDTYTGLFVGTITEEMMVMSGMDSRRMDEFLDAWKRAQIAPVSHKAVITPVNIFWTPPRLFAELSKEHDRYRDGRENK